MGKYNKFLVSVAGLVVAYLNVRYGNTQWLTGLVMILTSLGVYQIKNEATVPAATPTFPPIVPMNGVNQLTASAPTQIEVTTPAEAVIPPTEPAQ